MAFTKQDTTGGGVGGGENDDANSNFDYQSEFEESKMEMTGGSDQPVPQNSGMLDEIVNSGFQRSRAKTFTDDITCNDGVIKLRITN